MRNARQERVSSTSEFWVVRPDGKKVPIRRFQRVDHCAHKGVVYKFCCLQEHWVETHKFNSDVSRWDGLYSYCADCHSAYKKARWRKSDNADKETSRLSGIRRRYGLSPDRWQEMWELYGGRCHLCLEEFSPNLRLVHVDHCYRTGRIRGLLCHACNTELGFVERVNNAKERVEAYLNDDFNWGGDITPYLQKRLRPPEGDESHYEVGLTPLDADT